MKKNDIEPLDGYTEDHNRYFFDDNDEPSSADMAATESFIERLDATESLIALAEAADMDMPVTVRLVDTEPLPEQELAELVKMIGLIIDLYDGYQQAGWTAERAKLDAVVDVLFDAGKITRSTRITQIQQAMQ